ncbi:MAG TPA: hypothetical protein VGA49_01750 [Patescibacteria group bacterium]
MQQIGQFLSSINWAAPTWDLFIILFFIIAAFIYGLSLGRDRVIVIMVGIYMALAVVNNAPFINAGAGAQIGIYDFYVFKVTAFIATFIILFFLLSRSSLLRAISNIEISAGLFQVLIFSLLHVGLFVSITLSFLPPEAVNNLSGLTRQVFVNETSQFLWIIAPIVFMGILKSD